MITLPKIGRLERALLGLLAASLVAPRAGGDEPPALATTAPTPAPVEAPSTEEIQSAIDRGVAFFLKTQNPDGSWGSARRTKDLNIYAPVPGAHDAFRAAVTSLALCALIECDDGSPVVAAAIDRGEVWLLRRLPSVRRATPDAIYNVWTHAYSIQALLRLRDRAADDAAHRESLARLVADQFDLLSRYESVDGGWGYYDFDVGAKQPAASSTSFVSATVLVAFDEARAAGIDPPERLVRRAYDSILRQRNPDYTYCYGEYLKYQPRRGINRAGGSLGRSQACNVAVRRWGDETVDDAVLEAWLDRLYARNGWLEIGRKRPVPHEAWFQVAGYFYYYGHYYAAECIDELPKAAQVRHRGQLARILLDQQESDGSWWDFPFYDYHRPYGAAFAMLALAPRD